MLRVAALWAVLVSASILFVILREERLSMRGMVPLGRLRRFWMQKERRGAPRYRLDWTIRYQRLGADAGRSSQTRDLSRTGASLIVRERLDPGTEIQLEFHLPEQPGPVSAYGRVMWMREVSSPQDRLFYIGVRFHRLDPEIAKQFSAAIARGGTPL